MKIKNEYVKIKTNNEIVLHNYIYDKYLELFSQSQYETDEFKLFNLNDRKKLSSCFIKFDEQIEDIKQASIEDFDIIIHCNQTETNGNNQSVNAIYNYSTLFGIIDILNKEIHYDLNRYAGKKITALGFGSNTYSEIMACLDVFNYNVYVIKDEELNISRKDIFSSDAICRGYDYPIHLTPVFPLHRFQEGYNYTAPIWARLYSVGLGQTIGNISEEYLIGKEIQVRKESNTSFGFNLRKGADTSIFPKEDLYCGNNIFPQPFYVPIEIYPQENKYCQDNIYPGRSNYKYIIYKYRLCSMNRGSVIEDLDEYYTMSYKTHVKGLFKIITKMERVKKK